MPDARLGSVSIRKSIAPSVLNRKVWLHLCLQQLQARLHQLALHAFALGGVGGYLHFGVGLGGLANDDLGRDQVGKKRHQQRRQNVADPAAQGVLGGGDDVFVDIRLVLRVTVGRYFDLDRGTSLSAADAPTAPDAGLAGQLVYIPTR
jgi:hypothetical protein